MSSSKSETCIFHFHEITFDMKAFARLFNQFDVSTHYQYVKIDTFQCQASHLLCFICWDKLYKAGEKCPTCRGTLSDHRNIPLEKILEKLDGCNFERNGQAHVTEHEKNCIHKTFKCGMSKHGCNFEESTKTLVKEHENNKCETFYFFRLFQ